MNWPTFPQLRTRLRNALRHLLHGTVMAAEQPREARVGLLNTGELIVLLANGGQLVLGTDTTELVRDVLDADTRALSVLPFGFGGSDA